MSQQLVLGIEKCIGHAHGCLHHATVLASSLADLGLHDDLQLIQLELERLQVDLLRGTRRHMKFLSGPTYLSDSVRNDRSPAA